MTLQKDEEVYPTILSTASLTETEPQRVRAIGGHSTVNIYSIAYRAWFYFRIGYGTYLTFPLGYIGFLALIYQYFVQPVLPNLGIFYFEILVASLVTPAGIVIGYLHLKHTRAWETEVDISVEANPYVYKLQPGKEMEAYAPITLVTLQLVRKIAERDGILTSEEKRQVLDLESKMSVLLEGKFVSPPKRRLSRGSAP